MGMIPVGTSVLFLGTWIARCKGALRGKAEAIGFPSGIAAHGLLLAAIGFFMKNRVMQAAMGACSGTPLLTFRGREDE
jgi:hypothetical protein